MQGKKFFLLIALFALSCVTVFAQPVAEQSYEEKYPMGSIVGDPVSGAPELAVRRGFAYRGQDHTNEGQGSSKCDSCHGQGSVSNV